MRKALFLTIETGVEDMVRDGNQIGDDGAAHPCELAIPTIWREVAADHRPSEA